MPNQSNEDHVFGIQKGSSESAKRIFIPYQTCKIKCCYSSLGCQYPHPYILPVPSLSHHYITAAVSPAPHPHPMQKPVGARIT